MKLPKNDQLKAETLNYADWRRDPRHAEGDDIIFRAYVALHGRDSDYSSRQYEKSLENDDTVARVISSLQGRVEAVWLLSRNKDSGFLKARSGAPRRSDLNFEERSPIYSSLLEIANEEEMPIVVEPDMRVQALSDTLDVLGLSTVWCEEELKKVMGEEYGCTHEFMGLNKYGQARFRVTTSLGREVERRAYVLYPSKMTKAKTIVRVIAEMPAWNIETGADGFDHASNGNYLAMLQKDPKSSQTKQGNLWEFPGGNVDRAEDKVQAAVREFEEEAGINMDALGVKPTEAGEFSYQFFHKDGVVYEPRTTVFRANFPLCRFADAPKVSVVDGSDDRHKAGSWLSKESVQQGKVELTRASNLMRLKF